MYTRCQSRSTEVQNENDNQPQLATATKIAELRQAVQQQAELMQKQAEETRRKKEEFTRRQNDLFEAFIQRFLVRQGEDRAGPTVEQVEPEVRAQPQQEPRTVAPGLKPASERFMKRNPQVFEGTMDPAVEKE